MLTCTSWFSHFSSNAHHHSSLPQQLEGGLRPAPESRSRGAFPHLSRSLFTRLVHNKLLIRVLPQHTKAKRVERLRLPCSSLLPVIDRKRTKFQKSRLLGMQLQVELPHSLGKFRPKLTCLRLRLKSQHDIIRKTHDDHVAVRAIPTPRSNSQVEHIVKIDVSQQRRSTYALGRTLLHSYQ